MIVTEAEALQKRCPLARAHPMSHCVGSRCMGWTYAGSRLKRNEDGSVVEPPDREVLGCCGLAYAGKEP